MKRKAILMVDHKFTAAVMGLLLFLSANLFAQERIVHNPPNEARQGQDLTIECRIQGLTTTIRFARVYYREREEKEYKFSFLRQLGDVWRGTIPGADIHGDHLQYFVVFRLQNDKLVNFPEQAGEFQPEEIPVRSPAVSGPSSERSSEDSPFLILAPDQDQILESGTVLIAVSVQRDNIDPESLVLLLNSRNVTSYGVLSNYLLTFEAKNLSQGVHRIVVSAKDKQGRQMPLLRQSFYIRSKETATKPEAQFTGRIFTEGRYENIYSQNKSFTMGGAEFNGRYGDLDVQGRIFLTSLEDGAYQPRHRFYLALEHDNFCVQAGDVYPRYNDLMIRGKRVRGFAADVNAGVFKLETVFGQTYRAVEGSSNESSAVTHSGTFGQNLLGLRPSLNFRPFRIGMSLLKIKDDYNSISYGSRPKDNVVFGPDFALSLDNGRIELRAHAAYSLLTLDTSIGAFSKDDVEQMFSGTVDVPIDPKKYKSILIINDTTVPLNPQENTSAAYDINLKLNYYRNLFRFGYKLIGSDYFSLANSWLRKDIRGFYLSDRVRLFQNKLYCIFGLERYTDNYTKQGTKPSTDLNSLNLALSYYPGKKLPNLTINYRRYDRINGITDIRIDSLHYTSELDTIDRRENSNQHDLNIQLGYQIQFLNASHYFTLGYVIAIKNDHYGVTRLPGYFSQEMSTNVNMLTWSSTYHFPLRTTLSLSTNNNIIGQGLADFNYNSLSVFGEYKFFTNKLSTFGEFRYTQSNGTTFSSGTIDVQRNHIRAGAALYLRAQQTLMFEAHFITFSSAENVFLKSTYTDMIMRLRYEKLF